MIRHAFSSLWQYLPKAVEGKFKALFRDLSGMQFHNNDVTLTSAQFGRLPVIVFRLEAPGSGPQSFVDVVSASQGWMRPDLPCPDLP